MTDGRIIAYLLGELPEEESEQLEDECFSQESWPSQLNLVEDDLIDSYLRDELTPAQRQHFEQNYLTTELRQERVLMAAALLRHVDERHSVVQATIAAPLAEQAWFGRLRAFWSARAWPLRAGVAFAVVAIIAFALWLYTPRTRSPQTLATLTLHMGSNTRSEGTQAAKVSLPLNVDALKVSLTLPGQVPPATRYRLELEILNSDKVETRPLEIAGQDAQSVSVIIPAAQLARGQYALKLFAVKNDGSEQRVEGSYLMDVE